MMPRILIVLLSLCAAAIPARAELNVTATIPNLGALARAVGGKHVGVTTLSLPTQDPHFVDARPSLAVALNRADVLIVAGLQLESGWLPVLQTGARNAAILTGGKGYLDCSTVAALKDVSSGPVDRARGDIHPGGNPHYLADPRNAVRCAKAIADRLAALDPKHAAAFQTAYEAFATDLDARTKQWTAGFAPLAGTPVVVYHSSWTYLLDWLGLKQVGTLEPKPGIPPTPSHVAQLLGEMQRTKAKVILQESFYPHETSHLLAERTGAKVFETPAGPPAGGTYAEWMDALVNGIRKAAQ